jgi:bifunctional isochorismate lyase/aryl carrier protein
MQEYFINFWPQESRLIETVIHNIAAIKAFCKAHDIPVFYSAQPDQQSDDDRGLLNDMWGEGLSKAPEQKKIVAALAPDSSDVVLTKWRYSAFFRSDLHERLVEQERDQLMICGVYAHIGCLTTANEAFMRNIQPFMVSDALADFSRDEHLMALRYVAGRCGRVVDTQSILHQELPATIEALRLEVLPLLDEEDAQELAMDDNLIDYGLDSIQIMTLVGRWQAHAPQINFMALAKSPTLASWWQLIGARNAA